MCRAARLVQRSAVVCGLAVGHASQPPPCIKSLNTREYAQPFGTRRVAWCCCARVRHDETDTTGIGTHSVLLLHAASELNEHVHVRRVPSLSS